LLYEVIGVQATILQQNSPPAVEKPSLGLTTGDPAGIGPEISLRAALEPGLQGICRIVLFGDWEILRSRSEALGLAFDFARISLNSLLEGGLIPGRAIVDIPSERRRIVLGEGSSASGESAAQNVIACAEACTKGYLSGMVTAPLNKVYLNEAGHHFPGHTEFLAYLTGTPEVGMAFLSERLKLLLATIHMPLREAITFLSSDLVFRKLSLLLREFGHLGLPCTRVAVAGLNPHAGEMGLLGTEERDKIIPAIIEAQRLYPDSEISGPIPADTLFHRAYQGEFDAVLALYHDQGLIPIKLLSFGQAVNVTLGLPFVRTSVDHGTAFDIAGKGLAQHGSMISAIHWALRLLKAGCSRCMPI
jgi:4-phospho-D-threonate 3-dehydrogenase / 4-phospho-D-erythronate 3-dehydrogenase